MTPSVRQNFSAALSGVVIVCAVVLSFSGCWHANKNAVVVNVLRDPASPFFGQQEHVLLSFQSRRPFTSSGQPILVQSILISRPRLDAMLADGSLFRRLRPDLVILDSTEQAKISAAVAPEVARAKSACDNHADCPVLIPSWVAGEKLQATQQVLQALLSGRN